MPQAIVPDNLKSAVTRASKYEAELNENFAAFAEHYHTFGFPTRTYKPKDKEIHQKLGIAYAAKGWTDKAKDEFARYNEYDKSTKKIQ